MPAPKTRTVMMPALWLVTVIPDQVARPYTAARAQTAPAPTTTSGTSHSTGLR